MNIYNVVHRIFDVNICNKMKASFSLLYSHHHQQKPQFYRLVESGRHQLSFLYSRFISVVCLPVADDIFKPSFVDKTDFPQV